MLAKTEVPSPAISFFLSELRTRRLEVSRLLQAFKIDEAAPLLPIDQLEAFAAACAETAKDPLFALAVANGVPRGGYGLVEFLWRAAATPRAALKEVLHFAPLVSAFISARLESRDGGRARLVLDMPLVLDWRHSNEYLVAFYVRQLTENTAGRAQVRGIGLAHSKHAQAEAVERTLGAPAHFSQTANWIEVDDGMLDLPHVGADTALIEAIRRTLEPALARSSRTLTFVERVRVAVDGSLAESGDVQAIARQMRMSSRTLQRRLADEGTSFRGVVDRARRDRAERLVGDPKVSLTEIAFLLGFADASAFTRAFRRWTGTAPQQARTKALEAK